MSRSLHIFILTPTAFPYTTGNASTVERWRRSLAKLGHNVQVLATENLDLFGLQQMLSQNKPDVIHLHHAYRTGELFLKLKKEWEKNQWGLVVSPGGTDIYLDINKRDRHHIITQIFEMANAIIAQSKEMRRCLKESYRGLEHKIFMIPKSFFWMGEEEFDLRAVCNCDPENVLFFHPGGIRPVKGNLQALRLLAKVYTLRPSIRAVFAGPPLDQDYAAGFEKEINLHKNFARWIPSIPFPAMRSAYHGADIVLNFSSSEGISNVLLEAKASGKPILASDIPGNRWVIMGEQKASPAGLLFDPHSQKHFIEQALRLIDDRELRNRLGQEGRNQADHLPKPDEEAEMILRVYKKVLKESLRS